MRCWELIEDGQWPLATNQRPGSMMTDQSEAQSDDEDAFWWRVNIGVICYWAAHWLGAPGCSQSAAVLQTQTNVPCMCCMLQSTWSLRHINKYTQTLMDTEHLFRDERLWCRIRVPQDIGMTSSPAQMQWLDLKWRYREKRVAHVVIRTNFWLGRGKMIFCQKFIHVRAAHLS